MKKKKFCPFLGWRQDNRNRPNQESKFDFLTTRHLLGKIDGGQQKIKIVRSNQRSNLRASCQSIFSLPRHLPSPFQLFCILVSLGGARTRIKGAGKIFALVRAHVKKQVHSGNQNKSPTISSSLPCMGGLLVGWRQDSGYRSQPGIKNFLATREREKIDWQEPRKFDCRLVRTIFIFCCPSSIFTRH